MTIALVEISCFSPLMNVTSTLPALTMRPPWHGYSLGDWNEAWELFARNAVAGEWEKNGANTLARRRSGLTPETPVRSLEEREKL